MGCILQVQMAFEVVHIRFCNDQESQIIFPSISQFSISWTEFHLPTHTSPCLPSQMTCLRSHLIEF